MYVQALELSQCILRDFPLEDDHEIDTESEEGTRNAHNATKHTYENVHEDQCFSGKSTSLDGGRKDAHYRDLGSQLMKLLLQLHSMSE